MEKIWLDYYDPGVPHTIDPDQYSSIQEMLEESFKKYAEEPCFSNTGEVLSYQQVSDLSNNFAGYLQNELGLKKGDRIAMICLNILQYPIAMFGALQIGLIVVNINPITPSHKINNILIETEAVALFIMEDLLLKMSKIDDNTNIKHIISTNLLDLLGLRKKIVPTLLALFTKKSKKARSDAILFKDIMQGNYAAKRIPVKIEPNNTAFLQFTNARDEKHSKCVELTHRNIIANVLQCTAWIGNGLKQDKRKCVLNVLPMFHVFSLIGNVLIFLRYGYVNFLITNPMNVNSIIEQCQQQSFSILVGVYATFSSLLEHEKFKELDFSRLRFLAGGGNFQGTLISKWKALTGILILQGYGLTETCICVSFTPMTSKEYSNLVGVPLPSTDIKICDEEGNELPIGQKGELWVKGPQVMKGYWKDPARTKKLLTHDGWLRTEDIVTVNEKGFIRMMDRKSDLIKIENTVIYSMEIESVISSVKGVMEVAVVEGESKEGKKIIKAFVIRRDPSVTVQAILEYCRQFLPTYQVPHEIEFVDTLPRTSVGTVLKRLLRGEKRAE